MTFEGIVTVVKHIIDVLLVWLVLYYVLKSLSKNVKMVLIAGPSSSGKTTFANGFPDPLMLNTDGNIQYVDAPYLAIRDEITMNGRIKETKYAWEIFKNAVDEIIAGQHNYKTIIIDKKYVDISSILKQQLSIEIDKMIKEHKNYFNKFDKIVMYYDNGQETLGIILDNIFSKLSGFEHRVNFDHKEKRLFQVSDMLTYIDKYDYKYKNKKYFSKGDKYFFNDTEIRKILKALAKKRF